MQFILKIFIGLTIFLLISCGKDCKEYMRDVESESNGLKITKIMNGIKYSMQFKPVDYILYNEFKSCDIETEQAEKRRKELGDVYYFQLNINSQSNKDVLMENLANENEYYQRLNYCSFDMQDDFTLVQNGDSIICSLYHFQNNYGVKKDADIVLAFPNSTAKLEKSKKLSLVYKDYAFGNGQIVFDFDPSKIEKYKN
jgi:hypothetical protein